MKKYDFLANVQKHIEVKEEGIKKEELGKIISSLQRPAQDLIRAICEKQKKDVQELYKSLGWKH